MDFLKFHPRFSGNRDSGANLKKVLALVLAFACAFTMFAGAAFTDSADIKDANTEAVDTLVALGVINGYTDGSFKPNGTVTRAEMAKMIYTIRSGGNSDASAYSGISTSFTDVNGHWAAGYIKYCQTMGIIAGKNAKTFDPNGKVTVAETAKMALVTMGYKADKSNLTGATWMVNTINLANDNELLTDVSGAVNVAASRQDAAQILYNMLDADVQSWSTDKLDYEKESETVSGSTVTVDEDGKTTVNAYTTTQYVDVGKKYLGLSKPEGTLTSVKKEDNKDTYKIVVDGVTYTKVAANYINLLGEDVKVMIKDGKTDKVYGVYETGKNTVVTALLDDVDDINSPNAGKLKIDGTSYKTVTKNANNLPVFVTPDMSALKIGGTAATVKTAKASYPYYSVKFVDKNDDDKLDYAIATPYAVAQVDYLTTSKLTLSAKGNTVLDKLTYDLKDDDITLYDGAAEDDYAVVVESGYTVDDTTVVTKAETVSGAAARTKGSITDVYVGGNWYTVQGYAADSHAGYDNIKVNDEYDFAAVGSFIFAGEKTKGNISASNVLYVDKCGALESGIADGVEAKVYFADGTSKTIVVTELTQYADGEGTDYDIVKTVKDGDEDEKITNVAAATAIEKTKLFTYSEKNGEYSLDPISANNVGSYDGYVPGETTTTIDDGKTSAGVRFADDGVIFVNDKDGVKVVSGKTVTGWKTIKDIKVAGLYDKSNGTKYVAIGAIELGDKTAKTDTRVYGYVTSAISTGKEDNTNYLYFDMYTNDGTIEVKVEDKGDAKKIARESFIAFDWADEAAKEADSEGIEVKTAKANAVAITAFVADDSISWRTKGGKDNTKDFADDYYVIGVDTKNREGSAAKLATAKDVPTDSTKYQANAIVFTTEDGDKTVVEAVFIDVSGVMYTKKNGTELNIAK